ncbi:MFS general substrate transporter [Thelephora ganbajun]|uniref:MFS general substrate transporter n=1 Tax=Thelephora ganbajun TaxID=370292 RepID=A0ACB6ZSG4_THEGA|nr:MFS general substrate transporter [Thelephora ganbajun]
MTDSKIDEETPLLLSVEDPAAIAREESNEYITPLPKLQIGILLLVQLAEPICSQCIYPFVNQLISEMGIAGGDEKKVGYYAGIIESLFFLAEASSTLFWSRLSDYVGRKPVLLTGMAGLVISMTSFGLSKTFTGLVVSRCIAGLLNGNLGVLKSMMTELTDSTNRAQASGLLPLVWAIGVTIGPFAGGTLSRPHERFPALFGNWFWEEYPYLLSCLFSAIFCAYCFILIWAFLKETVKKPCPPQDGGEAPSDRVLEPVPPLRAVLTEPVVLSIASYLWLAFVDISLRALQPLFFATPIHLGGLSMSPATIGLCLGIFGLLDGTVQGLLFAKIIRRVGLKRLYLTSLFCFIPLFATFPVINYFAREWGRSPAVWALVVFQLTLNCITEMAFGCAFLYITSSVENPRALGSVLGIGQTTASLIRAGGPTMSTSLFVYTLENDWLGGAGVYVVLITLSIFGLPLARKLPQKAWEYK